MKVLSLSIDKTVADIHSNTAARMREYGELVEEYLIVSPGNITQTVHLSPNVEVYSVNSKNRLICLLKMFLCVARLAKDKSFDVITAQDPFETGLIGWLIARKYRIGLNIQEHGDFFSHKFWRNESLLNFIRYYVGKFLIKRAGSVRVVSERVACTLNQRFKLSRGRIVPVPIFIDSQKAESHQTCTSLKEKYPGKFIFLTMARLVKQKNMTLLINAFKKVADEHNNALLIIVGKGNQKQSLLSLVKKLRMTNSVEFMEWTNDVYSYYKSADAYVLSSNYEGWGMVIIEAALCRLPIIMTDVGCAGEVIKNGESGLVVPRGDQKNLEKAMIRVLEDKVLREYLGENARAVVQKLPDKKETLALYKRSWEIASKNFVVKK